MTKAAWIFCKNDNGEPHLPLGIGGTTVTAMDIHTITGGPSGFEHTHLLIGGAALPSLDREGETDEHHRHMIAWYGGQYYQLTIGDTNHQHNLTVVNSGEGDVLSPDWYLTWWKGSDTDAALILDDPLCIVACEAIGEFVEVEEDVLEEQFNNLDDTLWTAEERLLWETRIGNVLAISLPPEINASDKMVAYFCGALVSRPNQRERWLRGN